MGLWSMISQNFPSASLDARQESELVDVILEQHGAELSRADFVETLLQLLEDIAGFENPTPATLELLGQRLWDEYRSEYPKAQ